MVNMEKPDRSSILNLARAFQGLGIAAPGVSFRLGHTLWNRVDSGEKCLQR